MYKAIFVLLFCTIIALTFADPSLNDAYSAAISKAWSTGSFQNLYQQWFGAAPNPVPLCLKYFHNEPHKRSQLARILKCGVVRVGIGLLNVPYSYYENGTLKGFDVELAYLLTNIIGEKYNVSLEIKHHVVENFYQDLPEGIKNGEFDVIISDFTITEDRAQVMDITCGYAVTGSRFLRSGLEPERDFNSIADLNDPSVKAVLFSGTMLESLTKRVLPNATYVPVDKDQSKDEGLKDVFKTIEEQGGHVTILPEALLTWYLSTPNNCTGCSILDIEFVPPFYKGIGTRRPLPCHGRHHHGRHHHGRHCKHH